MGTAGNPANNTSSPPSPTVPRSPAARTSFQSHSRVMSSTTELSSIAPTRTNRFSMSFPVQSTGAQSPTRLPPSPPSDAPAVAPESLVSPTGPTDTNFLTAIATQERRVLELKEELQRTEADLNRLKRQWAQHEAHKKRDDTRRVTKLQQLQTSMPIDDKEEDSDGSSAWMQQEMSRRKALLSGGKSSSRTVFAGSRHTRTLSLLSPGARDGGATVTTDQSLPPRKESLSGPTRTSGEGKPPGTQATFLTRASTTTDLADDLMHTTDAGQALKEQSLDGELLIKTGKKMATDLKDGLWTFFEDLRQATVGDEATQIPPPHMRRQISSQTLRTARKQNSKNSLRASSRGSTVSKESTETKRPSPNRKQVNATKKPPQAPLPDLADPSFWTEQGLGAPSPHGASPAPVKKRSSARTPQSPKSDSVASTDAWDTWDDSPQASRSSSAASESNTMPSTVSGPTSPRVSTESSNRDPIPWPALSKLGPATLRRTASHLMAEWEKSLSSSPVKEYDGRVDYLGLSAEAAATSGGRKVD